MSWRSTKVCLKCVWSVLKPLSRVLIQLLITHVGSIITKSQFTNTHAHIVAKRCTIVIFLTCTSHNLYIYIYIYHAECLNMDNIYGRIVTGKSIRAHGALLVYLLFRNRNGVAQFVPIRVTDRETWRRRLRHLCLHCTNGAILSFIISDRSPWWAQTPQPRLRF